MLSFNDTIFWHGGVYSESVGIKLVLSNDEIKKRNRREYKKEEGDFWK